MKKFFIAIVVVSCFLFTSCVEIVQMVYMENGKLKSGARIVISPVLLSMSNISPDSFFESLNDISEDELEAAGVQFEKIQDDTNIGFSFVLSEDSDQKVLKDQKGFDFLDVKAEFFPIKTSQTLEIPMGLMRSFENGMNSAKVNSEDEEMATALMMGEMKYRLFVSKSVCPRIQTLNFVCDDGKKIPATYYSIGDSFCIEASFSKFMNNSIEKLVIQYK